MAGQQSDRPPKAPRISQGNQELFGPWLLWALGLLLGQRTTYYRHRRLDPDAIALAALKACVVWNETPLAFNSREHLLRWLRRTAYWKTLDGLRQAQRQRWQPLADSVLDELPEPESCLDLESRWDVEDVQTLWLCLDQLPRLDRKILLAYYFDRPRQTDRAIAGWLYRNEPFTPKLGLKAFRRRKKAEALLRVLLEQHGVGEPV